MARIRCLFPNVPRHDEGSVKSEAPAAGNVEVETEVAAIERLGRAYAAERAFAAEEAAGQVKEEFGGRGVPNAVDASGEPTEVVNSRITAARKKHAYLRRISGDPLSPYSSIGGLTSAESVQNGHGDGISVRRARRSCEVGRGRSQECVPVAPPAPRRSHWFCLCFIWPKKPSSSARRGPCHFPPLRRQHALILFTPQMMCPFPDW